MSSPLVSIVTIVLNAGELLEKTIKNVLQQTYENIEYIIIDGGSSDNCLEIIKKYEAHISCWVSESDEGISDAFNKGILASTGDWIIFLNAGDLFAHSGIIANWIAHENGNRVISSFAYYSNNEKRTIPKKAINNDDPLARKSLISHQATMIRREIFNEYGFYNKNYRVRMDYEFWLRVLKYVKFEFIPIKAVKYDTSGVSFVNRNIFYLEEIRANTENLTRLVSIYWNSRLRIRRMIKRILGAG